MCRDVVWPWEALKMGLLDHLPCRLPPCLSRELQTYALKTQRSFWVCVKLSRVGGGSPVSWDLSDICPSALSSGDPAVGKTALVQMFRSDGTHFQKNYTLVSWGRRVLIWSQCKET